eukprot:gene4447-8860_t
MASFIETPLDRKTRFSELYKEIFLEARNSDWTITDDTYVEKREFIFKSLQDVWSAIRFESSKSLHSIAEYLSQSSRYDVMEYLCSSIHEELPWQTLHGSLLGINAILEVTNETLPVFEQLEQICLKSLGNSQLQVREASRLCLTSLQPFQNKRHFMDLILKLINSNVTQDILEESESSAFLLDGLLGYLADILKLKLNFFFDDSQYSHQKDKNEKSQTESQSHLDSIQLFIEILEKSMSHCSSIVRQRAGTVLSILCKDITRGILNDYLKALSFNIVEYKPTAYLLHLLQCLCENISNYYLTHQLFELRRVAAQLLPILARTMVLLNISWIASHIDDIAAASSRISPSQSSLTTLPTPSTTLSPTLSTSSSSHLSTDEAISLSAWLGEIARVATFLWEAVVEDAVAGAGGGGVGGTPGSTPRRQSNSSCNNLTSDIMTGTGTETGGDYNGTEDEKLAFRIHLKTIANNVNRNNNGNNTSSNSNGSATTTPLFHINNGYTNTNTNIMDIAPSITSTGLTNERLIMGEEVINNWIVDIMIIQDRVANAHGHASSSILFSSSSSSSTLVKEESKSSKCNSTMKQTTTTPSLSLSLLLSLFHGEEVTNDRSAMTVSPSVTEPASRSFTTPSHGCQDNQHQQHRHSLSGKSQLPSTTTTTSTTPMARNSLSISPIVFDLWLGEAVAIPLMTFSLNMNNMKYNIINNNNNNHNNSHSHNNNLNNSNNNSSNSHSNININKNISLRTYLGLLAITSRWMHSLISDSKWLNCRSVTKRSLSKAFLTFSITLESFENDNETSITTSTIEKSKIITTNDHINRSTEVNEDDDDEADGRISIEVIEGVVTHVLDRIRHCLVSLDTNDLRLAIDLIKSYRILEQLLLRNSHYSHSPNRQQLTPTLIWLQVQNLVRVLVRVRVQ